MHLTITKDVLKTQVKLLREFLPSNVLTQSSAYECIARIHGWQSWNELSAAIVKEEKERADYFKDNFSHEGLE